MKPKYELCFAKRPAESLYDLKSDPHQLRNVAEEPRFADAKQTLADRLTAELEATEDPRITGGGDAFDRYPYFGGAPQWENDR